MRMIKPTFYAVFGFAAILLSACGNQKAPAQMTLDNATSVVNTAASPDAMKYLPDDVTALQTNLANLKASFDKQDYAGVIAAAPDVVSAADALTQSVATKKDAESKRLTSAWTDATGSLPATLQAVHARVDELTKARHPPKQMDLATARSDLSDADSSWEKATSSFSAGKAAEAVATAREAKAKAEAAAAAVNLQLPETPAK